MRLGWSRVQRLLEIYLLIGRLLRMTSLLPRKAATRSPTTKQTTQRHDTHALSASSKQQNVSERSEMSWQEIVCKGCNTKGLVSVQPLPAQIVRPHILHSTAHISSCSGCALLTLFSCPQLGGETAAAEVGTASKAVQGEQGDQTERSKADGRCGEDGGGDGGGQGGGGGGVSEFDGSGGHAG